MPAKHTLLLLFVLFLFSLSACELHLSFEEKSQEWSVDGSIQIDHTPDSSQEPSREESIKEEKEATEEAHEEKPKPHCVISCAEIIVGSLNVNYDPKGPREQPYLLYPGGMAFGKNGEIFITETSGNRIRVFHPDTGLRRFAGTGEIGHKDGSLDEAEFYFPISLALDSQGNLFVGEATNRIRKITPDGNVTTFVGNGIPYPKDGVGQEAQVNGIYLTIDKNDNLYLSDTETHQIRKITPQGVVTTIAGTGQPGNKDGLAHEATFSGPRALTTDAEGNLYIFEWDNYKVRKLTLDGQVSTFAGTGTYGDQAGSKAYARFDLLADIAMSPDGSLYATDLENRRIIQIDKEGTVIHIAGSGKRGFKAGTIPSEIEFTGPVGLLIESEKTLLVSEGNQTIRRVYLKDCPCLPPPPNP
jgi:sugar lactone lactonase YvrE